MDNSDQKDNRAEGPPKDGEGDPVEEIENPGIWRKFLDEVEANVLDARAAFQNARELISGEMKSGKFSRRRRGRKRDMQPGAVRLKLLGHGMPQQTHVEAFSKGLANVEQSKSTGIRPILGKEVVSRFRNVLIVGGMDFLGAALIRQLNAVDFREITVADSLSDEVCRRLPELRFREFLTPEELRQMAATRFAFTTEYSHIFYLDEWKTESIPLTKALLIFAAEARSRFITISSASSMGAVQPCDAGNRHDPQNFRPLTQAGVISCLFDRQALSKFHNKNYISLKHYQLFGRRENEGGGLGGLVNSCYSQIRSTGSITLPAALKSTTPEGRRKYDFFFVEDAARIALYLAQNHLTEGIYELGSGKSATPAAVARAVIHAAGGKGKIVWDDKLAYVPPPPEPEYARLERLAETGWKAYPADLSASIENYISGYHGEGTETGGADEPPSPAVSKKAPWSHSMTPHKNKTADAFGD
jgi:nucleoside-diphosphate-sugar epimerase